MDRQGDRDAPPRRAARNFSVSVKKRAVRNLLRGRHANLGAACRARHLVVGLQSLRAALLSNVPSPVLLGPVDRVGGTSPRSRAARVGATRRGPRAHGLRAPRRVKSGGRLRRAALLLGALAAAGCAGARTHVVAASRPTSAARSARCQRGMRTTRDPRGPARSRSAYTCVALKASAEGRSSDCTDVCGAEQPAAMAGSSPRGSRA